MDAHLSRFLGAIKLALPYARLGAAEVRTSSTDERTTIDVLSPVGLIATTTIYTRPSSQGPAQQLPLFATVESPAPPRPDAPRALDATPESAPTQPKAKPTAKAPKASSAPKADACLDTHPAETDSPEAPPSVLRWVAEGSWRALMHGVGEYIPNAPNALAAGSAFRELGPMSPTEAADIDDTARILGIALHATKPDEPTPTVPAKKKPAPGSSARKTPHRLTAIPEADALAEHGKLVAVALQPDGHWKVWATNPAPETGLLLTSPAWKSRWSRARKNDLRVRLYNRARRCTHDSLDGDIGAENDAAA